MRSETDVDKMLNVRGEGRKFHLLVFVGFIVGAAVYAAALDGPISAVLGPIEARGAISLLDLFR